MPMSEPEQILNVQQFVAVMDTQVEKPPELHLTAQVEHAETNHEWVQALVFSREQVIELTQLLVHVCDYHALAWRRE